MVLNNFKINLVRQNWVPFKMGRMYVPMTKEQLKELITRDIPGDQIDVSNITDMELVV